MLIKSIRWAVENLSAYNEHEHYKVYELAKIAAEHMTELSGEQWLVSEKDFKFFVYKV